MAIPLLQAVSAGISAFNAVNTVTSALNRDNSSATAAAGSSTASATPGRISAAEQEDRFLRLLVTQMRNQDPLNPVDSADFAVQLATFSGVEQQVRTNDLLGDLGTRIATLGLGQLSGWIGMEAQAQGPVEFRGQPVTLGVQVDPRADAAELVVTDMQGIIVQRLPVPARSGPVVWPGLDPAGLPLPQGTYRISAHSLLSGDPIARQDVVVHGRIAEARLDSGETMLVLESGQTVPANRIVGLRPGAQ